MTFREWWGQLWRSWRYGAVKRRKALMPRMTCPECGNVVAYSARTKLTSAHKCGGAIVQRSITGAW